MDSKPEGIKKIEIIKKDGKFHINVVKEECDIDEDITDDVLKRISRSLNNKKKTKFPNLFGDSGLFEKSMIEKQAYRQTS